MSKQIVIGFENGAISVVVGEKHFRGLYEYPDEMANAIKQAIEYLVPDVEVTIEEWY